MPLLAVSDAVLLSAIQLGTSIVTIVGLAVAYMIERGRARIAAQTAANERAEMKAELRTVAGTVKIIGVQTDGMNKALMDLSGAEGVARGALEERQRADDRADKAVTSAGTVGAVNVKADAVSVTADTVQLATGGAPEGPEHKSK